MAIHYKLEEEACTATQNRCDTSTARLFVWREQTTRTYDSQYVANPLIPWMPKYDVYLKLVFIFASVSPSWGGFGNIPGTDIYKKVKDYKNVSNCWVVSLHLSRQWKTELCLACCKQPEFGSDMVKYRFSIEFFTLIQMVGPYCMVGISDILDILLNCWNS